MIYRAELDGLRAVAVISVLVYHANLQLFGYSLFQGGFFGVDVFFVLSGFLITSIISYKYQSGSFNFIEFFWGRFKRIIPALFFVLFLCSLVAYFFLLPDQLNQYIKSLESAIGFYSNYYFLNEDAYTSDTSLLKPLLHTWSLSVEWQFYLFYPMLYYIIFRITRKYIFSILFILTLLSFQTAVFFSKTQQDVSFYIFPTRSWEFFLGGIISFFPNINYCNLKGRSCFLLKQIIPILSLYFIFYSFLFLGHDISHPSWVTLLPVFGTGIYIIFANKNDIITKLLSTKIPVFFGLISYSLYLWHQPIFAFYRNFTAKNINFLSFFILSGIAILLSWLTMKYIETPFRVRFYNLKKVSILVFLLALNILIVSLFAFNSESIRQPFMIPALESLGVTGHGFKLDGKPCVNRKSNNACKYEINSNYSIILFGDSHAGKLGKPLYDYAKKNGYQFSEYVTTGCVGFKTQFTPYYASDKHNWIRIERNRCLSNMSAIHNAIDTAKPSTIVYNVKMTSFTGFDIHGKKYPRRIDHLELLKISDLFKHWIDIGHKVILVYPTPEAWFDVPKMVSADLAGKFNKKAAFLKLDYSTLLADQILISDEGYRILDSLVSNSIYRVYPRDIFCSSITKKCKTISTEHIYYSDSHHLSNAGVNLIFPYIIEKIEASFESKL